MEDSLKLYVSNNDKRKNILKYLVQYSRESMRVSLVKTPSNWVHGGTDWDSKSATNTFDLQCVLPAEYSRTGT